MKPLFMALLPACISITCMAQDSAYLFCYFKQNGKDGLHLAYSLNGYHYKPLNKDRSLLTPVLSKDSLMRDPCIIRGQDGRFHMVWTVSWNDRGIGYASSADLLQWSPQQYLPVMQHQDSALNCWAPEITYDNRRRRYLIYWATTIAGKYKEGSATGDGPYNHRMYYVTTKNFRRFSKTKLLY
ncbi:MAG TPA: glycosyl hydrolase, partial [Phnomibacter sp.]|nr:glycosyl hydrolase [Phnomibacter sp.]